MPDHPEGWARLRAAATKFRSRGLGWGMSRIAGEASAPTSAAGAIARAALAPLAGVPGWLAGFFVHLTGFADRRAVTLFYDLEVSPVTFDFVWALAAAEKLRVDRGLARVDVVFVPARRGLVRAEPADYEAVIDATQRQWRVDNLLTPLARAMPSVEQVTVAATRRHAGLMRAIAGSVFPRGYLPSFPRAHRTLDVTGPDRAGETIPQPLRAHPQALNFVADWFEKVGLGARRLIVITIRSYGYGLARNSNLGAWLAFARSLDPAKFFVVFVPDTQTANQKTDLDGCGFPIFDQGAYNVFLRHAIYSLADLNLMVNGGPMGIAFFDPQVRYLVFKMIEPRVAQSTAAQMERHGFEIGQAPRFLKPWQRWNWNDDTPEQIAVGFAAIWPLIESMPRPLDLFVAR